MSADENIEIEKLKFEKFKFWFQMVAILASIVATLIGAYIAFFKYFDEKNREYDLSYFKTLANLESDDLNIQKASILELCRFKDKYKNLAPILIDFLEDEKRKGDVSVEKSLLTSFLIIGNPIISELTKENQYSYDNNKDRFNVIQETIVELIREGIGNKLKHVDFNGIILKGISLHNVNMSGISLRDTTINEVNFNGATFTGLDLSEADFNNCSFWQTKFEEGTNLNNSRFNQCMFRDTFFDCDLRKTTFPASDCVNIKIADKRYINQKTFTDAKSISFADK